jgi:hypothetical protein
MYMGLISQSNLETRLGRSLTTDEANDFTIINDAMQTYVERMIGSSLETAVASTRYYDGGVKYLKIDPCTDITALLSVDEDYDTSETIDESDYIEEPYNQTLKTQITYRYGKLYSGERNFGVTAKFSTAGDTHVTNIIKNALLDALVSELDNSENITKESIEGYSVEKSKPETKNSLDKIKFLFPEII